MLAELLREGQDGRGGMGEHQERLNSGRSGELAAPEPVQLGTRWVVTGLR